MYATLQTISPKGMHTTKTISHTDAFDTIRRLEQQRGYTIRVMGDGTAYIDFPDGWKYRLEGYFAAEYW